MFEINEDLFEKSELKNLKHIKDVLEKRKLNGWMDKEREEDLKEHLELLETIREQQKKTNGKVRERIIQNKNYFGRFYEKTMEGLYSENFLKNIKNIEFQMKKQSKKTIEDMFSEIKKRYKEEEGKYENLHWSRSNGGELLKDILKIIIKVEEMIGRSIIVKEEFRTIMVMLITLLEYSKIEKEDVNLWRELKWRGYNKLFNSSTEEVKRLEKEEEEKTDLDDLINIFYEKISLKKTEKKITNEKKEMRI